MEYTSKFVEMWLDKKTYPDYFELPDEKRKPTTWAKTLQKNSLEYSGKVFHIQLLIL